MAIAAPVPQYAADASASRSWRELAAALSLANLCYVRVWSELLTYSAGDTYTMKLPYSRGAYVAVMLNVLLAGVFGWSAALLVRRRGGPRLRTAARWVFFLLLLLPVNAVRAVLANRFDYLRSPLLQLLGTRNVVLLALVLAGAGLFVLLRWPDRVTRAATATLLILSPLVAITFAQAIWRAVSYDPAPFRDATPAAILPLKTSPRIVWVVLDEWDERLTFIDRPAGIALPELDRLRRESLFAANALPPGSETLISMPAFLTGREVTDTVKRGPSELLLRHPGAPRPVSWLTEPNLFSDARAAGFNTALVGWYHPYCRVIGASLNHCERWEMNMQYNTMGRTFGQLAPGQTRSLFETSLLSLFGQSLPVREHARTYQEMMTSSLRVLADRRYGLTLLHLPIPHAPHTYDRRTGRFDLRNSPIKGYADSLVLADRTVGEIRRTLERAGLWDSTTVLFTADHGYRAAEAFDGKKDQRIPFLLKMPGHAEPIEYTPTLHTIVLRDLFRAILRGDVATTGQVAAWLDARRSAPE